MAGEETTFGCGTFLPGFGPGNFPDFDGGGTIDGGDGGEPPDPPDDQGPPIIIDDGGGPGGGIPPRPGGGDPGGPITYWVCGGPPLWKCTSITKDKGEPPPPGAWRTEDACKKACHGQPGVITPGAPPTGPPPPAGPPTPGGPPGAPGAGDSSPVCECKIVGKPEITYVQTENTKGVVIKWKQKCSPGQESGDQAKIDKTVDEQLKKLSTSWVWTCGKVYQTGTVGADCKEYKLEGETCTGKCGKIIVYLECTKNIIGEGDRSGTGPTPPGDGIFTGGEKTNGKHAPGGPGTPGGPPIVPPGGGAQKPYWYCADTGGVKGCRYDSGWGPKTLTFLTKAQCLIFCLDDDDEFFDGETTEKRDETGGGIIDGGGEFFDGETTGERASTGAGGLDGGGGGYGGNIDQSGERFAGGGVTSFGESAGGFAGDTTRSILSAAEGSREFDLNSPVIASRILREKPAGIEDPEVAFITTPPRPKLVKNNTSIPELFNDRIDSNIEYVLSNQLNFGNWDSTRAAGITPDSVYASLKPKVRKLLEQIRNYDGTFLTKNQIFSMIGSRILDGTISQITLKYLEDLAKSSKKRNPVVITRSSSNKVNEVAALALVDRDKFTLDPTQAEGVMKNILPNWKTLASDIDKYIEITISGEVKKYYIKDDNTFINRITLGIDDGDYFDIKRGSASVRLYTKSEIDHAYLLPEQTRQQALSLLGGETGRILEVSASILSDIEFDYSLSTPRQDFYMLSCVLSSIDTKPNLVGSFLLKDSVATYELMDTTTADSLRISNDYIKYKANHRVFLLDDEDIMLDYIQTTSSLTMKQTDILADSPKENKTIPLLTRQIPWYIMVYPTNRSDINLFNTKSKIKELSPSGVIIRQLKCNTSIVPNFSNAQTNKFIRFQTQGLTGTDVFGKTNLQARVTHVTPSDTVFKTGYEQNDELVSAENYIPSRKKTGLRLLKEIITELDTNYLLGLNGIGKSLTEFDVFSRLTLQQFNILSRLDSFKTIRDSIRNGLIEEVKVIPPINRADKRISFQKTQLVRRRADAPTDTFTSIKATNDNETIIPPTTTEPASFGPVTR